MGDLISPSLSFEFTAASAGTIFLMKRQVGMLILKHDADLSGLIGYFYFCSQDNFTDVVDQVVVGSLSSDLSICKLSANNQAYNRTLDMYMYVFPRVVSPSALKEVNVWSTFV